MVPDVYSLMDNGYLYLYLVVLLRRVVKFLHPGEVDLDEKEEEDQHCLLTSAFSKLKWPQVLLCLPLAPEASSMVDSAFQASHLMQFYPKAVVSIWPNCV